MYINTVSTGWLWILAASPSDTNVNFWIGNSLNWVRKLQRNSILLFKKKKKRKIGCIPMAASITSHFFFLFFPFVCFVLSVLFFFSKFGGFLRLKTKRSRHCRNLFRNIEGRVCRAYTTLNGSRNFRITPSRWSWVFLIDAADAVDARQKEWRKWTRRKNDSNLRPRLRP